MEWGEEKSVQEIVSGPALKNSDIIRSPVSADGTTDTVNVAKMSFEQTTFDFRETTEGEVIEHTFSFTNTGKKPLLISNAKSTCGCTVPSWPRKAIMPGDSGEIEVKFNTKNKVGQQIKTVTITANTYPSNNTVYVKGYVNAKE